MGCSGDREKGPPEEAAKWDFLTLSDFRCTSAWTGVAYGWLWFMALVAVVVYVLDTYTAVNLLIYNHWSSKVQPALDFKYSKWIFALCILLSWLLCIYEWIRAVRIIRRGGVAESFLDPLAVTLQSIRSKGWKRFLVFTDLTKSKKGADYVALFVYFAFKGAIRVILAEGPRQAVNAMTLYAVLQADLIVNQKTDRNSFDQFWYNVQHLADENYQQAVVYCSMLFTLIIWVFSAISLIIAGTLYIFFLWHYIPQRDGRLSVYCRRKVDRRLGKIVEHKVKAALEKEERKAEKAERKAELQREKTGQPPPPQRPSYKKQPTLPYLAGSPPPEKNDKLSELPLARQVTNGTVASLPPYSMHPPPRNANMQRPPTLPRLATGGRPDMTRSDTQLSSWSAAPSYSTEAPLLANAGHAGGPQDIALPPSAVSRQGSHASFQFHGRTDSQSTQGSRHPYTPGPAPGSRAQTPMSARPYTPMSGRPYNPMSSSGAVHPRALPQPRIPLSVRSNTALSFDQNPWSASPQDSYDMPLAPPRRANTADDFDSSADQQQEVRTLHSQRSFSRPMRNGSQTSFKRPFTPATSSSLPVESYEMQSQPVHSSQAQLQSTYVAFNPSAHSSNPAPQESPKRNITVTGEQSTGDYFGSMHADISQRSVTAPIEQRQSSYAHDILDEYRSDDDDSGSLKRHSPPAGPPRSLTAGPSPHSEQWRAY